MESYGGSSVTHNTILDNFPRIVVLVGSILN